MQVTIFFEVPLSVILFEPLDSVLSMSHLEHRRDETCIFACYRLWNRHFDFHEK